MELNALLQEFGAAEDAGLREVLKVEWGTSQSCRPGGTLPFLSPESVADACRVLSLPTSARDALLAVAEAVAASPAHSALAWHFHYCAFRSDTYLAWAQISQWPSADHLGRLLGEDGRTFCLLILASGLPGMQKLYDARGIPAEVFSDTLLQLKGQLAELQESDGVWGLTGPGRVRWYRFALRGELFRLGRLVYQFGLFRFHVKVFRHRASHAVAALSEGGVSYLANGQADGEGRKWPTEKWTSELTVTSDGVTGHPVLPTGRALRQGVHLPAAEWEEVLVRNDPALYLHFPGGSPLAQDLCAQSFECAMEFFPRHFPEKPFKCFCCNSWLLNSRLQDLLPPTANLVRFQREVYLLPFDTDDMPLVNVILGGIPEDPGKAPRETTLQRAVLDSFLAGDHDDARAGAFFLLPEDLNWGQQVYLRQEPPWEEPKSADWMTLGAERRMQDHRDTPEIAPILAWWLPRVHECLGDKIHTILLYGSATLGDFCPRWSDVDVCVVLQSPITQEEGESVGDIHDRMYDRFVSGGAEGWESGQGVEGPYIPIELVEDESVEAPCYSAGGTTRKWEVCQPISPFDRYILAHFSRALSGSSVSFRPPSELSLAAQTEADLAALQAWDRAAQSAIWLAGMLHWAARSLVFWRDGTMLPKSAALEREIAQNSPFADVFRLALAIRREGSAVAARHHQELKRYYSQMALDLANEIERDVKGRRGQDESVTAPKGA